MPLESNRVIDGKYRILRLLGEGGMGAVYEGVNERIGRRVAIKVLHAEAAEKPELRRRFEREAQVAGKLASPHICEVLDVGDLPDGDLYIVMEFLEGQTLTELVDHKGKLTLEEFAPIWYQLLEGLRVLHEAGIVHRDLKPANVFVCRTASGQPHTKLLDFGVSKWTTVPENATSSGAIMGTPLYMAPEQARGLANKVDARTDIYAVGVCAYTLLSGTVPFAGENVHDLLFRIALNDPPPLEGRAPWVSPAIAFLVHRAMARDPEHRFQSAREFQVALVDVLERELPANKSGVSTLVAGLDSMNAGSWRPSSGAVRASTPIRTQPARSDPAKATHSAWAGQTPSGSQPSKQPIRWSLMIGSILTAAIVSGGVVWKMVAVARSSNASLVPAPSATVVDPLPVAPSAPQGLPTALIPPADTAIAVPSAASTPPTRTPRPILQTGRVSVPPATATTPTIPTATPTTAPTTTGRVIRKEL